MLSLAVNVRCCCALHIINTYLLLWYRFYVVPLIFNIIFSDIFVCTFVLQTVAAVVLNSPIRSDTTRRNRRKSHLYPDNVRCWVYPSRSGRGKRYRRRTWDACTELYIRNIIPISAVQNNIILLLLYINIGRSKLLIRIVRRHMAYSSVRILYVLCGRILKRIIIIILHTLSMGRLWRIRV